MKRNRKRKPLEDKLKNYQLNENGCWVWLGCKSNIGYGKVLIEGENTLAHRFFYLTLKGPIPEGLCLDHLCRNRACVNPDHLEPVTPGENTLRGVGPSALNRKKTHCLKGHPFDPSPVISKTGFNRGRICKICKRDFNRDSYYRMKLKRKLLGNT